MRGMAMQVLTGLAVCACAVGAITVPLVVLGVPSPGRIIAIPSPETPEDSVIAIGPGSPPLAGVPSVPRDRELIPTEVAPPARPQPASPRPLPIAAEPELPGSPAPAPTAPAPPTPSEPLPAEPPPAPAPPPPPAPAPGRTRARPGRAATRAGAAAAPAAASAAPSPCSVVAFPRPTAGRAGSAADAFPEASVRPRRA